ncbi:hypothetical protein ABB37_04373 [Leptomonas pyrrhocoris]|uniref:Uncharacterized protein n=1 Tax=Leptomonas pyrrhocoris TaxID=157538 RepID=A0A0M9G2B8_LEPPY|nr:hypothetical protein ABB37_04373 [Leptomonas pyrrhocoris]KPA80990.1 hypothetical protein ABB37_04373 [Leptomonas pyrrhocoris]|eukprot:XP_015659429.1 hypothetical protein ABB37_04373 [Leptomonas pyrrhocoris]
MPESNWAVRENGARIADVSSEAANGANAAANLLKAHEEALWLAGPAPQHVTLALSAQHPLLRYAGWHVWLDLPTNPKVVEIASGPSLEQLRPILVCEALPGAGTQVWQLPRPIPAEHTFVRFKILESFGPGPTYMNTLALLANDPGPNYSANDDVPAATAVSPSATVAAVGPQYANPTAATPYASRLPLSLSGVGTPGGAARSPLPRHATSLAAPRTPPAGINMSVTSGGNGGGGHSDDGGPSDVGVFVSTNRRSAATSNAEEPLSPADATNRDGSSRTRSPRMRSNSRMRQLLRELDNDIKQLKPIKSVSPGKNMLMYLPQDASGLEADSFDENITPDRSGHRRGSNSDGSGSQRNTSGDGKHRHGRHTGHSGRGREGDDDGGSSGKGARHPHRGSSATSATGGNFHADPQLQRGMHPAQMGIALYPPSAEVAGPPPLPPLNATYDARLNALEQAVAALNEAVQHQRDDLTMIKRLLLQQAVEGRKEAEQRFEEKQRYERLFSVSTNATGIPSNSALPAASPASGFMADQRLTHRSITVDFPEDTLRVFVNSVLDHRLRKYTKKLEAKLLQRLDTQLHDVIKVLSATVDGQLANVTNVAAATATAAATSAAGASMSTPRSMYAEQESTPSHRGRTFSPVSQSSRGLHTSRDEFGHDNVDSTPRRGGAASSASSKGGASHTPRSQTETGVSAFHPRAWSSKR